MKLGRDSGSYENLAEGYINCIRVLKEDNLKFYVLQYYEDFLRISLERENQQLLFQSEDAKEGLAAYVEKRPSEFKAK